MLDGFFFFGFFFYSNMIFSAKFHASIDFFELLQNSCFINQKEKAGMHRAYGDFDLSRNK